MPAATLAAATTFPSPAMNDVPPRITPETLAGTAPETASKAAVATPGTADDRRWAQVLARDPAAAFFYAVVSTGIFCRPSCPSRRPARPNVRFFSALAQATAAGFRPCLRCRPHLGDQGPDAALVEKLCAYLRENLDRTVSLEELGEQAALRGASVQRTFVRVLGISPKQFQLQLRADRFRTLLSAPGATQAEAPSITDSVYAAGYSGASRLYTDARQKLGMTPSRYRDRGRGETIRYALAACPAGFPPGFLLVAATTTGICWVAIGDDAAALETDLRAHFHEASIIPTTEPANTRPAEDPRAEDHDQAGPSLQQALHQVLSHLTARPAAGSLPLDLRATAFQQRVWQALAAIPRGETRSYAQVAQSLGQPTAARAVARACAGNPVALLVPCHRVIGAGGDLTGYRWGRARKQALLALEKAL